jgi:hypothetical protein
MKPKLTEDMVVAIKGALEKRAPKAWAVVDDLVRRSPFTDPIQGSGRSIGGYFSPVVKKEEYEFVLAALEVVARVDGSTAQFGGRQVNFILMQWRSLNPLENLT